MAISNAQYQEVLRHFLTWVRRKDPVGYETLIRYAEIDSENVQGRAALLRAIDTYARTMQPATTGTHAEILRLLNEHILGDIRGVQVLLSPQERDLYQRKAVDLTPTVDKTGFVSALKELHMMVAEEGGHDNEGHGFEG